MSRLDRITTDPELCHGQPTVRGLRYPVATMLELLASGMTIDEILADYPDLEHDDLRARRRSKQDGPTRGGVNPSAVRRKRRARHCRTVDRSPRSTALQPEIDAGLLRDSTQLRGMGQPSTPPKPSLGNGLNSGDVSVGLVVFR